MNAPATAKSAVLTLPRKMHVIHGKFDDIPSEITNRVWSCVKGSYQRDLLQGRETWSGSTLRGKAAKYGGRYAESRRKLIAFIQFTLRPYGWRAATALVLRNGRWHRELILVDLINNRYVW